MSLQEHLNSDGQQFHQYKQTNNHFLPRSTEHKKKKEETMTYAVGIPGSVLGQAQQCREVLKFLKSYWWSVVS